MGTLNERVLHKLGSRGSVVVAVPPDWLRYNGLKPGDKVEVITNGEITIRAKGRTVKGTLLKGIDSSDG